MENHKKPPGTGISGMDQTLHGLQPGDNVVFQVETIDDYTPFVLPFCMEANRVGKKVVYFHFAQHKELIPENIPIEKYYLHPDTGFEQFISEVLDKIDEAGSEAYYVFDCLTELAADWSSDRMLGNFFILICKHLYNLKAIAYFSLLKNTHSSHAIEGIHSTAQVILDIYRNKEKLFINPIKVWGRYSPTMNMLHVWNGDELQPVTNSSAVTEILSQVPQPWLDFTFQRLGVWTNTFAEAHKTLDAVRNGRLPKKEEEFYFHRLLRMAVTREERLLRLVKKYFNLSEVLKIRKRMIGTGLIGGKSVGMLLARAILKKENNRWHELCEEHDSFFIGSDVFYTYVVQNDCWWILRKRKDISALLDNAESIKEKMQKGVFPQYIRQQFIEMLDYFGQCPIIVRSSSLLEDAYGNAFSGKYDSVFCTNQGTREERLDAFISAVRKVYASTINPEALIYREQRGLLEREEQMALLVQRVSGDAYGELFFPHIAGVGYSFNPFAWNSDINPQDGVIRMVLGLGTRAVDRHDDDYTRIVALGTPDKRPEANPEEVRRYTQRMVDLLDIKKNQLTSYYFSDIVSKTNKLPLHIFTSPDEHFTGSNNKDAPLLLTFKELLSNTNFVSDMEEILRTLQKAYEYPVDIEYASNFMKNGKYRINILQCRPFQVKQRNINIKPPANIREENIIIKAPGHIIGNSKMLKIDRLVYVVPSVYGMLPESKRYLAAKVIGRITHTEENHKPKTIMLIGPGRWGTTTPSLGVPVTLGQINTVSVLCEVAVMHDGLIPDISLGTHFFNDLVEMDMAYMAVYPGKDEHVLNEDILKQYPNRLPDLLPDDKEWADTLLVIDPAQSTDKGPIYLNVNTMQQQGLLYLE